MTFERYESYYNNIDFGYFIDINTKEIRLYIDEVTYLLVHDGGFLKFELPDDESLFMETSKIRLENIQFNYDGKICIGNDENTYIKIVNSDNEYFSVDESKIVMLEYDFFVDYNIDGFEIINNDDFKSIDNV